MSCGFGTARVANRKLKTKMILLLSAAGEFSAPLAELHDAWWNSIARATALIFF